MPVNVKRSGGKNDDRPRNWLDRAHAYKGRGVSPWNILVKARFLNDEIVPKIRVFPMEDESEANQG